MPLDLTNLDSCQNSACPNHALNKLDDLYCRVLNIGHVLPMS